VRNRVVLITLALLALVSLPYIVAALTAGPEYVFGGFLFNPVDGNTYLAKMYQGWRGEWLYKLPYTAQPGEGAFLFVFYNFLGHTARLLGLSLVWTFHIFRLLGALILAFVLYRFLGEFSIYTRWRVLLFAWALLGAGLGWLVFPFGLIPSDFWVAEAYPFLSSYANPHFPLGLALLLTLLIKKDELGSATSLVRYLWRDWLAGVLAFLLAIVSPFGVIVAFVVLGVERMRELWIRMSNYSQTLERSENSRRQFSPMVISSIMHSATTRRLMWIFVCGAPLLFYDFWIARVNPVLAIWNAQNLTPSPPMWDILIAFSPALILALLGAWSLLRRQRRGNLMLTWAVLGLLLVYLPFGLQRRFMMGLFVPIVGLMGFGLGELANRADRRSDLIARIGFAASLPSCLLLLFVSFHGIQTHNELFYMTRSESNALAWIEANTPAHALVLASPQMGLFIPAHTGRRVIYGHPFETVNALAEEQAVETFFQNSGDPALVSSFLEQRGVDYVFYGPREYKLGASLDLSNLLPVYEEGDVTVFKVIPGTFSQGSG
jgi:hypothetical protein